MILRLLLTVLVLCATSFPVSSAVMFDTDFETCAVGTGNDFPCEGWTDAGQELIGRMEISTEQAFSGTKSVKQTWIDPAGPESIPQPSIYKDVIPNQEHFFLRFRTKRMPGWIQSTNGITKRLIIGNLGFPRTMIHDYFNGYAIGIECPYNLINPATGSITGSVFWSSGVAPTGGWDKIEMEYKLNTPGQGDGLMRMWINDVLRIEKLNLELRGPTATSMGIAPGCTGKQALSTYKVFSLQFFTQSGKGVYYNDRPALCTGARCPSDGSTPVSDTIPPSTPTTPTATVSGSTGSLGWVVNGDNGGSGYAGTQLFRCDVASCDPAATAAFTTVPTTTNTYSDFNLSSGVHRYCYKGVDGGGLTSPCSAPIVEITVAASPIFFTPVFVDNFDRADGTLGANWTGSFTARSDFAIISNQLRVDAVGQDSLQVYNGTTADDQYNSTELVSVGGAGTRAPGLTVRMQTGPAVNGYECRIILPSTSRIAEFLNGSGTTLVTNNIAAWTWQALDVPQCEAQGTALRFYAIRAGVKTLLASTTDATYTSGKTGFIHFVQNTGGNTTSTSQIDKYIYGTITTTPPVPPSILSLSATASNATVTWNLTTPPTQIRLHYGDNAGLFSGNIIKPLSDFPGGVYPFFWPAGTQYLQAYAIDSTGTENPNPADNKAINMSSIVASLDTDPVVFGDAFPVGDRPEGTTETQFGVPIDKSAACRWDTTDHDYDLMPNDAEHNMTVASLVASSTVDGLSSASPTTLYVGCAFTNSVNDIIKSPINKTIVITVAASTPDPTPPGDVTNLVATAIPDSTDISATWTAVVGAIGYQMYLASGDCSAYSVSGNPLTAAIFQTTLNPDTDYCLKVKAIGSNNVLSANFSNIETKRTFSIPDRTPPPRMTGLRMLGQPFAASVLFVWDTKQDLPTGPVRSQLEFCVGVACTDFVSKGPRIAESQQVIDLTPGTFYRGRGIHYDLAGNPSGGLGTEDYSDIVSFTTASSGPDAQRPPLPFGTDRAVPADRGAATDRSVRP